MVLLSEHLRREGGPPGAVAHSPSRAVSLLDLDLPDPGVGTPSPHPPQPEVYEHVRAPGFAPQPRHGEDIVKDAGANFSGELGGGAATAAEPWGRPRPSPPQAPARGEGGEPGAGTA